MTRDNAGSFGFISTKWDFIYITINWTIVFYAFKQIKLKIKVLKYFS